MLRTELVRIDDYYKRLSEVSKRLDATNVGILSSISATGPRNLLEVSRRTRIPFTTVYHRVAKLEADFGRIAYLVPTFSKLGLTCLVVIATSKPGFEDLVTKALKIPNYWWSVTHAEGGYSHHSVHCVPAQHVAAFRRYLAEISRKGLTRSLKIIQVGDYATFNLNFEQYDAEKRIWEFPWNQWLHKLARQRIITRLDDPDDYPQIVNRGDLLIIKELQKNARKTFADLAPMLGMTLQGVKYKFDRLTSRGACKNYWIDVLPFPTEISAMYEIMVNFRGKGQMNKFYSFIRNTYFILSTTKILKKNTLLLRAYVPELQVTSMFRFLSELARRKMIVSYSALRLRLETRKSQTISYELFDDQKGWIFDYRKCVENLRKLSQA